MELQPYTPNLLPTPRTNRALGRLSTETTIAIAFTQAKAEIEAAKVDGVSAVAAKALQALPCSSSGAVLGAGRAACLGPAVDCG